jgi:hypothetical protein
MLRFFDLTGHQEKLGALELKIKYIGSGVRYFRFD